MGLGPVWSLRVAAVSPGPESSRIEAPDLDLPGMQQEAEPLNLRQVREAAEREAVVRALGRVEGNIAKAAELLGVSRPTLYDMMGRYQIPAK